MTRSQMVALLSISILFLRRRRRRRRRLGMSGTLKAARRNVHLGKHTQEGGKVGATTTKTRCSREQHILRSTLIDSFADFASHAIHRRTKAAAAAAAAAAFGNCM